MRGIIPELRLRRSGLGEKDGAGEEHDANEEEEDEKTELTHAGTDRLAENLKPFRVTRQLEDAEHSHQANNS